MTKTNPTYEKAVSDKAVEKMYIYWSETFRKKIRESKLDMHIYNYIYIVYYVYYIQYIMPICQ